MWHHRRGLGGAAERNDGLPRCVTKMAELTAIVIKKFDGMDFKSWSLEIAILLDQKQVLGIADGTEDPPDSKDVTEFKAWKMQHAIVRSTILLAMERSLQQPMIPPVQQWISPDRNRPVQSRSSPRNFWTRIRPIPVADRLDWAWSGRIPHGVQG